MRVRLITLLASGCALGACVGYFEPVRSFEPILTDEIAYEGRTFEGWVTFVEGDGGLGAVMTPGGPRAELDGDAEHYLTRRGVSVGDRRYIRANIEPVGICVSDCRSMRGEGFYLKNVRVLRREAE